MSKGYITENFTTNISVDEYILRFRDEKRFIELCKQCSNYGNSWGCPPFDFDTGAFLRQYKYAYLMATKIVPIEKGIPIDKSQELIRPERIRIEKELLKLELRFGCLYCPDSECARKCNRPCLHPDKVRPSLEAFGFDIAHTLSELFGIELLWSNNGILPEYLVLVSGFFHNSTENIISHTNRNQDSVTL